MKSLKNLQKKEKPVTPADQLVTKNDYRKNLKKWLLFLVSSLVATTIALVLNYTVTLKGEDVFGTTQGIIAFLIMILLLIAAIAYSIVYFIISLKYKYNDEGINKRNAAIAGFVAGFGDTIGVSSFALSTATLKGTKNIKDDTKLPGTLNVAFAVSATIEAALFVGAVKIDLATLGILLVAVLIGTYFGSLLVTKIKDPKIVKIVMGVVLFVVGIFMIINNVGAIKISALGDPTSLIDENNIWRIIVGVILFLFLGGVQSFGVGSSAPAIAGLSLLGMDMKYIFVIITSAAALSMVPAAINFIRKKQYMQLTSNMIQISSVFGAALAFSLIFVGLQAAIGKDNYEVFSKVLKWIGTAVIFYVSITMLVEYYLNIKKNKKAKVQTY
ncbi:sulfite exporter TauE/SafE family protein [Williamsoniiplasma lucivorax]|uniref:Probable membrane transporter protein n=1 Tax=Williamsoniiplasma lucivorax TaxID=209274 RepID=A0A2S5RF05_9MOLU|nr:sulfite exporter TauE/SafE family protein [Williamsoniiplasma lucivorax]PPE05894.1 hypothetical protein ELUCI_v1c01820 [Williamsoniiplasma lucivorax]